jgi:GH35 family endo-1,4-beta-xylanase
MQGHFGGANVGMDSIKSTLDHFQAFDLPIWITEYDLETTDKLAAAAYTKA